MVRVVARLAGIFLAVYLAVSLGYARLEKELLNRSCCVTGLSSPVGSTVSTDSTVSNTNTNTSSSAVPAPEAATQRLSEPEPKPGSEPGSGPEPQSLHTKKPNFQIIVRRNIFQLIQKEKQKVTKEKLPPPPVQKDVVQKPVLTQLNLTLLGTVQGDRQTSRAIIMGGKKKEQKLYRVGDAVENAIIESIERGQVVLDVSGKQEILTMKKRKGGGPGQPQFNRGRMRRGVRNTPSTRRNRISPPEPEIPDELEELEEMEDIEELEELEDLEETEEDELATAKKALNRRRPPSIRPHRRINFRRNPIRNIPKVDQEEEE